MFKTGNWKLMLPGKMPLYLHWSIPVAALVFSGFSFRPGFWVGFFALVLVHELGHAFIVKQRRLPVIAVQVHGLGGVCVHPEGSAFDGALIAWGGVLAQFLVFYVPTVLLGFFGLWPEGAFWAELHAAWTMTNLWLIGFNLIPIAPLDGHKAWQLFRMLPKRSGSKNKPRKASKAAGESLDAESVAEEARRLAQKAIDDARMN